MSSRRALLIAGLLPAACGFRPLHATREGGAPGDAELAAVRVAPIVERNGQLLRRGLERRLASGGTAARYDLRVGVSFGVEIQGYRRDGTPSRVRYTATANWALFSLAVPPAPLTRGEAQAFDAYNIPENQFFASDVARDSAERRLMEQLSEDVAQRLAVWFAARAAA